MNKAFEQNPWWKEKGSIEADYDILKWKNSRYKWIPDIVKEMGMKPFAFHIISGPRQAGKTTAVKLLIRKMLKSRNPRSLFYFNCENIADYKELYEVLESYLEFKEANSIKNSIIILDEIAMPKEWYRAVKSIIDKGKAMNDIIIATGSSSMSVKRHVELFPGRRGHGKDFVLYPLSFRGFLRAVDPELAKRIPIFRNIDDIAKASINAELFEKELNKHLEAYMEYGGFPLSIANLHGRKEEAKRAYLSWIINAVLKAERSDIIAQQILKVLVETIQTPISWEGVSKKIEVKSPKTVAAYADLLRSIFAITVLYNIDVNEKKIRFGKNKKIYPRDPLLLEIFEDWCMTRPENKKSAIAESLVIEHLVRKFPERVFFWKNGFEIDAVVAEKKGLYGFEAKWSGKSESESKSLPQLKGLMVITKDHYSKKTKTHKIPLSVFLSMFDV